MIGLNRSFMKGFWKGSCAISFLSCELRLLLVVGDLFWSCFAAAWDHLAAAAKLTLIYLAAAEPSYRRVLVSWSTN